MASTVEAHVADAPQRARAAMRTLACKPCRERKRKCDGSRPCQRCIKNGRAQECADAEGSRVPNIMEGIDLSPDPGAGHAVAGFPGAASGQMPAVPPSSRGRVTFSNSQVNIASDGGSTVSHMLNWGAAFPQRGPAAGSDASFGSSSHGMHHGDSVHSGSGSGLPSTVLPRHVRDETRIAMPMAPGREAVTLASAVTIMQSPSLTMALQGMDLGGFAKVLLSGATGSVSTALPGIGAVHAAALHSHCGHHAFVKHLVQALGPQLPSQHQLMAAETAQLLLSHIVAASDVPIIHMRAVQGGAVASISPGARALFSIPHHYNTQQATTALLCAAPAPPGESAAGTDLSVHVLPAHVAPVTMPLRQEIANAAIALRAPLMTCSAHFSLASRPAGTSALQAVPSVYCIERTSYFWRHRELAAPPDLTGMALWFAPLKHKSKARRPSPRSLAQHSVVATTVAPPIHPAPAVAAGGLSPTATSSGFALSGMLGGGGLQSSRSGRGTKRPRVPDSFHTPM